MRRFTLHRADDVSGVSGTGAVAEGVEFADGTCAMRWLTTTASTAVYASAADIITIHGHEGRTRLVWQDPDPRINRAEPAPRIHIDFQTPPPGGHDRLRLLTRRQALVQRVQEAGLDL